MPEQNKVQARPMTVTELSSLIGLSRTRMYQLVRQGRFPGPELGEYSTRPFYSADGVRAILRIKADGIAMDGKPITFNRVLNTRRKSNQRPPEQVKIGPLLEYIEGLGLAMTASKLERTLATLYPEGWEAYPQEEVVQKTYQVLLEESQ